MGWATGVRSSRRTRRRVRLKRGLGAASRATMVRSVRERTGRERRRVKRTHWLHARLLACASARESTARQGVRLRECGMARELLRALW
jgi:hypothetical protein